MKRSVTPRLVSKRNRRRKPRPLYCVEISYRYWELKYPEWKNLTSEEQQDRIHSTLVEFQRLLNLRGSGGARLLAVPDEISVMRLEPKAEVIMTALPDGPIKQGLEDAHRRAEEDERG